jgi:hypothetical protein
VKCKPTAIKIKLTEMDGLLFKIIMKNIMKTHKKIMKNIWKNLKNTFKMLNNPYNKLLKLKPAKL